MDETLTMFLDLDDLFPPSSSFDIDMEDASRLPLVDDDKVMGSPGTDIDGTSLLASSAMNSSPCPSPRPSPGPSLARRLYPTPSMSASPAPDDFESDSIVVLERPPKKSSLGQKDKKRKGHATAPTMITPKDMERHMDHLAFPSISPSNFHAMSNFLEHFKALNRLMKDAQKASSGSAEEKNLLVFDTIKDFIKIHALGPIPSKTFFSHLEPRVCRCSHSTF